MSLILRQSTAKAVSFGPFLDKGDGVTPETGLVSAIDHGSTGILLSKNGGALTIRHASVTASTYDAYGNYIVTLDATDTNTIGTLRMQFIDTATCLPVWQDFNVVDEAVYDVLFGTTALATVSNITAGTITTATNVTTVNGLAANVITATAINNDAFTAAKFHSDVTTELQTGLATAANLATVAGYLDTEIAAILADTNELQTDWADGGRLDLILDARASQTSVDDVPTAVENADALLDRNMATGADNGSTTVRTPRQALRFLRNAWAVAGGTLTVKKEDDTTTSWTAAVTATAGADPITESDPAGP